MEKVLYVNACVRENSRTKMLAEYVLKNLKGEINEICLEKEGLKPLNCEMLKKRESFVSESDFSDEMFKYAKDFAFADIIVIAAPYWDLTFPALLKIYLEQITVCKITFCYSHGAPKGLCRAKRLIYVTTAGGQIYDNFGYDYVKTLAEKFYGIKDVVLFKAENLDVYINNAEEILSEAKGEIDKKMQFMIL